MSKEFYLSHSQDKADAFQELDYIPYPYMLMAKATVATPEQGDEWDKRKRQMAYLHRSVVPEFADCIGETEDVAKVELQKLFLRCGEIAIDEAGQFDVVWIDGDNLKVFELGKQYYIQSVAGLSNKELAHFIEQCKRYILMQYGRRVREFINNNPTKKVK